MQTVIDTKNPINKQALQKTVDDITESKEDKTLKYYEVRQPFDNDDKLKETQITQFKIIW